MRYLLLIYGDQSTYDAMSEADVQADMQRWFEYTNELEQANATQGGAALQPVSTATSLRTDGSGEVIITDGPFAETKEQLGGYYLLDVPDLDEAIKWARKCPGLAYGTIELRPVMEFEGA
jgi:hypothetical protein